MRYFLFALIATITSTSAAQVRYLNEVFTDVNVTTDVVYGTNVTVLPLLQGAPPAAQPLACDIYEPAGDTETNRPLIIYIHTGNFLPQFFNGTAVGTKSDSVAVELCTRYAKMGYVVASIDYRLGWNPLAVTQSERTYQLINATYRGVQDARTAVRFFRKSEAEDGDPYGIDPSKIGYLGEGTGGYISYAASTISDYNDIFLDDDGLPISKFWTGTPGTDDYTPMVIEAVNGDPEAVTDGYAPAGIFGSEPLQLCIANHMGYSSDVSFQVNLGGALLDLAWLDHGDPALISFQSPVDQFAPYTTNVVVVPTTNENVVEVSGAFDIHSEINAQADPNNNASYQALGLSDVFSTQAVANGNMGWDGLYPVKNDYLNGQPTQPFDSAPWQWWDVAYTELVDAANGTTIAQTQLFLNPNMGPLEGRAYCDTIVGYSAPRLVALLDLAIAGPGCTDSDACNFNALATSDDGSCAYPQFGYDCSGNPIAPGCTDPMACNYDNMAQTDDDSCGYLGSTTVPTGSETPWVVGLTVTGTPFETMAGGCEFSGGVNPNLSINGVIVGDGSAPLSMAGIQDPTGLLGELAALASTVGFSICGDNITLAALGNIMPMVDNGQFWVSPIPVNENGQYLWVAHLGNFPVGCADPAANNFSSPCDLSLACTYDVVFSVDMNTTEGTTGVAWAGTANGWNNTSNPMSDDDMDGVYEVTISLPVGAHEYKFIQNTDWGLAEAFNGFESCTTPPADFVNRVVIVAGAMSTEVVCYNSCEMCPEAGCTDPAFAEFDPYAGIDDGSCQNFVVAGCMYEVAINFNPLANLDDGSCVFECPEVVGTCGPGTFWDAVSESCLVANPPDVNLDGCVSMTDLLDLLSAFGTCVEEDPEVVEWSCGDPQEYQGYDYETVQIGEQCWFAENLRAESYRNGDAIPTGSSLADWDEASGQGYQVAYGGLPAAICEDFSTTIDACDPAQSLDTYGLLYNNFAVTDSRGICPQGWHVGTDEDWGEFEVFLGMDEATVFTEGFRGTNQGTMIKTTTGWQNNGSGTDEVGFHGHPSGGIAPDQDRFGNGGSDAVWWTPSETYGLDRRRSMNDYNDGIRRGTLSPTSGAAIRCMRD